MKKLFGFIGNKNDKKLLPTAFASISGSDKYPDIKGQVKFYPYKMGTLVEAEISGLPNFKPAANGQKQIAPFAFHIHEGKHCSSPSGDNPFSGAGNHYNPTNQPHGNHAGDLPSLISNNGFSLMSVFTNRFKPADVVGRTVIIHENPDDYMTQPSGSGGIRIACGEIKSSLFSRPRN